MESKNSSFIISFTFRGEMQLGQFQTVISKIKRNGTEYSAFDAFCAPPNNFVSVNTASRGCAFNLVDIFHIVDIF